MRTEICDAIRDKRLLEFYYEGGNRIVEPHCYGITTAGNEGLRANQIKGFSRSSGYTIKMFDLTKVIQINILEETFNSPHKLYKRGDKGMSKIYCEL